MLSLSRVRIVQALYLAGAFIVLAVLSPGRANAASLVADYRFDGNFNSSVGAAQPLDPLLPVGTFTFRTLNGKQVPLYSFSANSGVRLKQSALPHPASYSTIVNFAFDDVSSYRRLLAFDTFDNGSDNGVYSRFGRVGFYDNTLTDPIMDFGPATVLTAGTFADLAFTRGDDGAATGYIDGVKQFTHADADGKSVVSIDGLRYFKDNGSEASSGAVSRIRVYDGALTAAEVQTIQATGGLAATASATGAPKLSGKKRKPNAVETGITLTCPGEGVDCPATGTLTTTKKGKTKTLGTFSGSVASGATSTVTIALSKKAQKLIIKKGKITVAAGASITPASGVAATATAGGKV